MTPQSCTLPVKAWKRYVDNTFIVIRKDRADALHEHFNRHTAGVSFAAQKERAGMLPFLDVEVRRQQDGSIKTAVHRKATHIDSYLNFESHHRTQHKGIGN